MKKYTYFTLLLVISFASPSFAEDFKAWNHYFAKEYDAAFAEFSKDADAGKSYGQYGLGMMYHNNRGIKRDFKKAAYWYKKAVAHEGWSADRDAAFSLGNLYYEGWGVEQSNRNAFKWTEFAAKMNQPAANYRLGLYYEYGIGTLKDLDKSLEWYNHALRHGVNAAAAKIKKIENKK